MIDWTTEEAAAALAIAGKQRPRNCTDFQAAEIIVLAKSMLFYTQLTGWAEKKPDWAPDTFSVAAKALKEIIDKGYDPEHKTWWYMGDLDKHEMLGTVLLLADFGSMLEQLRQRSMVVVAATFWVVLDIILGRDWQRKFQRVLKEANARRSHGPTA